VVVVASDLAREAPPAGLGVAEVVAGLDAFASSAERMLAGGGGNTVLSPLSMAVAFAMASAGARGRTVDDIAGVFGFPDQPGLHPAMNGLTAVLDGQADLSLANSLWTQAGFAIEAAFLDTLAVHYGAGVRTTDFVRDPGGSRQAINAWVASATRDRIPDLLDEGAIGERTRLVLVNAVYLKAAWRTAFDPVATADAPFHRADGTTVSVPTMHLAGLDARYAVGDGYVAVELPYEGGELAMLVVVPDSPGAALPQLGALVGSLGAGAVNLALPRWESRAALDLGSVMTELGLPLPGGDLSGIAPELEIGTAVHAADITVDERGTEAAAATAIVIRATSAVIGPPPVDITVDRPFLFAVRHVESGAPLFVGRVVDPSA
jgi:serine protease inhibitor